MKQLLLAFVILMPAITMAQTSADPLFSMPLAKMFWSLYQERNIIGQNDCSNKCGRYLRALVSQGYEAEIIVIRPYTSPYLHAVIKLTEDDKVSYLDPTNGIVVDDLATLGSFKQLITYSQLEHMGEQFK